MKKQNKRTNKPKYKKETKQPKIKTTNTPGPMSYNGMRSGGDCTRKLSKEQGLVFVSSNILCLGSGMYNRKGSFSKHLCPKNPFGHLEKEKGKNHRTNWHHPRGLG